MQIYSLCIRGHCVAFRESRESSFYSEKLAFKKLNDITFVNYLIHIRLGFLLEKISKKIV